MSVATSRRAMASRLSAAVPRIPLAPLAIGALTLAVFGLRLSQMDQSIYGDEIWTYQDIVHHSLLSVIRTVHTGAENSPPLFFVLAWLSAKLGDPTIWMRLPSLVLGTATIPLLYRLGARTVGRRAGLVAAALVGLSPFANFYGIEARPYATVAFFVTLSTLALLRALEERSAAWWLLYALAGAAAAYSHYTTVFVLGVQGLWSLWAARDRLRAPLLANLGAVILYLPWLSHVRGKSLNVIAALEPLTMSHVLTDLVRVIPGYPYASLGQIPTISGLAVIVVCGAIGAVMLARHLSAGDLQTPHLRLLIALALATPVGLLLYSVLSTDLWLARGLTASIPAIALLAGLVLGAPRMPLRLAVVGFVLLTLVAGTIKSLTPRYARPPLRTISQYLDRVARPGDPVIMYAPFFDLPILEQLRRPHAVIGPSGTSWRRARRAGVAYFLFEDAIAARTKLAIPHPMGLRIAERHHYGGLVPVTMLIYRTR